MTITIISNQQLLFLWIFWEIWYTIHTFIQNCNTLGVCSIYVLFADEFFDELRKLGLDYNKYVALFANSLVNALMIL